MTTRDDDILDLRQSLVGVEHLIQTYQHRQSTDWLADVQRPILASIDQLKIDLADNQRAHESSTSDLTLARRSKADLEKRMRLLKDDGGMKKIRALLKRLKRDLPEGTTIETILGIREGSD